jgi:2-methylcitrate dehydratase PrpD
MAPGNQVDANRKMATGKVKMNTPNTNRIVRFIVETTFDDIPAKAWAVAREAITDCVGVALAGSQQPAGEITARWARAASGGLQSTVWGAGFKTSVHDAALVNGCAAHALDFDDVTWGLIGHPSASLVPAVLTLGEFLGASGKDVLLAYAVGFEVMAKIGRTTQPSHSLEGGWHATSSIGSFGTSAACCKLLRLDAEQTGRALGIVYSMTSGNVSNFGTMSKPLHAGLAARNGVQSAQFSKLGFTALSHPFDGPRSFHEVYSRGLPSDMSPLIELGSQYELATRGVVIKPYPCGVAIHPGIDAALDLRREFNIRPDDVDHMEIGVTRYTFDKLSYHMPTTGLQGKFSMEYGVARALVENRVTMEAFTDQAVQSEPIQRLLPRIKMFVDDEIERAWKIGSRPVHLRIWLTNGKIVEKRVDISRGNPEFPLTSEELGAKFADCAKITLDPDTVQSAMDVFRNIDQLKNVSELTVLLAGSRAAISSGG